MDATQEVQAMTRCLPLLLILCAWTQPADERRPPRPGAAGGFPPALGWTTQARCIRVIDGDTIEVEVRRVIRVRMLDCWAPESRIDARLPEAAQTAEKQSGIASRENLRQLCEGRDVIVQIPSHVEVAKAITLNRWLANVWIEGDGESLAEKQVKGGFAETTKPERLK
jgi:endonuclease YncB( thermonuclease family)